MFFSITLGMSQILESLYKKASMEVNNYRNDRRTTTDEIKDIHNILDSSFKKLKDLLGADVFKWEAQCIVFVSKLL